MNEKMETYKLIFEHFKLMEHRYHTWMNYYSLFNGALLVAYCTILVSVGKIVEKSSYAMPMADNADGRVLFSLDCTYWEFLMLIAILGVIASICWFCSMQGHTVWLENWRNALKNVGYEFDWTIYVLETEENKFTKSNDILKQLTLYSTAKITTCFIKGIIAAWGVALVYACPLTDKGNNWLWSIILGLAVIVFIIIVFFCCKGKLKSDTNGFHVKKVSLSQQTAFPPTNEEWDPVWDIIIELIKHKLGEDASA